MKRALLYLLLFFCSVVSAQDQKTLDYSAEEKNLDSLKSLYESTSDAREKIEASFIYSTAIAESQITGERLLESVQILEEAYDLSNELKDDELTLEVLTKLGSRYWYLGNHAASTETSLKGLDLAISMNDTASIGRFLARVGYAYHENGFYEKGIIYYKKALEVAEYTENNYLRWWVLTYMAECYMDKGDYFMPIALCNNALETDMSTGDSSIWIAESYVIMAKTYSKRRMNDSADYFFDKNRLVMERSENSNTLTYNWIYYFNSLAEHEILNENWSEAEKILDSSLYHLSIVEVFEQKMLTYQMMMEVKGKLGKYLDYYEMSQEFLVLRDSMHETQSNLTLSYYENQQEKEKANLLFEREKAISELEHKAEQKKLRNQKFILFGGIGVLFVISGIILIGYRRKKNDNLIIENQKREVEEAHQEITDSIHYAKRIQMAILPPPKLVKEYLNDSFILYKPKDVVAGDFYWMEPKKDSVLFAAADCTGHGVPGAMVSVICNNGLNRSAREFDLSDPGEILTKTRELVIAEFEKSEEDVKDGMDIALCSLEGNKLKYAGAHNPLWIIRNGSAEVEEIRAEFSAGTKIEVFDKYTFIEVKADKQPIGKYTEPKPFTTREVELKPGDTFYIFSDGFADQFGGEKGKKFKAKNFKKLLLSVQTESMERQKALIDEAFESWRGGLEQLDDVCVIGVRI